VSHLILQSIFLKKILGKNNKNKDDESVIISMVLSCFVEGVFLKMYT